VAGGVPGSPLPRAPPAAGRYLSRPARQRDPFDLARGHAFALLQRFGGNLFECHKAHSIREPELDLTLEERKQRRRFHLGMDGVHFGTPHDVAVEFEENGFVREPRHVEGLVPRGERGGNFEGAEDVALGCREEWQPATRIRRVEQIEPVLHQERQRRRVPAWRRGCPGPVPKNPREFIVCAAVVQFDPGLAHAVQPVVPAHVVPPVHAHLMAGIAHGANQRGEPPANLRRRQQRAGERCPGPIEREGVRAQHLAQKPLAREDAEDGAPGIVGAQREEERRANGMPVEEAQESGQPVARALERVTVDLERQASLRGGAGGHGMAGRERPDR
jgi:hypothetical protein